MEDRNNDFLFQSIKEIILQSRQRVFRVANSALLESYWHVGKLIVEDEQKGNMRAEYGKATLKTLASRLTLEFGKGYDESNLRNIRSFFKAFPIRDALRHELNCLVVAATMQLFSSNQSRHFEVREISQAYAVSCINAIHPY